MDIKDIIKIRREELGLTYEELGKLVGVGKSTVRKWETGMIENMRRDNIVALSKALNISPSVIMGWDSNNQFIPSPLADKEPKLSHLSTQKVTLINNYDKLNDLGKAKLLDYSNDLVEAPKYIQNNIVELPTATEELSNMFTNIAAHDDDLTADEKAEADKRILEAIKKLKK